MNYLIFILNLLVEHLLKIFILLLRFKFYLINVLFKNIIHHSKLYHFHITPLIFN
jgi:hypothetical protein